MGFPFSTSKRSLSSTTAISASMQAGFVWRRPYVLTKKKKQMLETAYPRTYLASRKNGKEAARREIFDPALKHFIRAFRLADPSFREPELEARWRDARMDQQEMQGCASRTVGT